ncbi:MAG: rRNA pseudouridine synthase [Bacteroidales bacterium]|nr:rRNA pseudouridine synthase [Candidatus Liminaster caballi]
MEENFIQPAAEPQKEGGETQQPKRRPRIGESRFREGATTYEPRQSYSRGYDRQGGYQPRQNSYDRQGGYDRQDGYQPRGYQPRHNSYDRQNNYDRQGGYDRQDGGYQSRGYQPRQGGYQQGGYQRPARPHTSYQQSEGYQSSESGYQQSEGGYQPRGRQQGGYGRQQQGGYGRQQQGGYGRQQQGGYGRQQGGYGRQQGGYDRNGYQQRGRQMNNNNRRRQQYNPHRPVEYTEAIVDPNEELRLNKFLANAGVCSRREADDYIQNGSVKVNGEVVTELGTKVTRKDSVTFNDQPVSLERKVYVLLNKPKDTVTTSDDPQGRQTVMDLVRNASQERIYPVGRLDRNTTGVLLLTNDGDLASKLTHPKYVKKKIYHVWLDKDVAEEDLAKIAAGIELEDGPIHADAIAYANEEDKNQVGIEIHSGKNRIVRRIFEHLGYRVVKLDRVYFAGLTKKNLPRGRWRHLTQQEVNMLKMGAFE